MSSRQKHRPVPYRFQFFIATLLVCWLGSTTEGSAQTTEVTGDDNIVVTGNHGQVTVVRGNLVLTREVSVNIGLVRQVATDVARLHRRDQAAFERAFDRRLDEIETKIRELSRDEQSAIEVMSAEIERLSREMAATNRRTAEQVALLEGLWMRVISAIETAHVQEAKEQVDRAMKIQAEASRRAESARNWALLAPTLATAGAGVVVGMLYGLKASNQWDDARDACPGQRDCPNDTGHRLSEEALRSAQISTVSFVVAGLATVAALTIYWGEATNAASGKSAQAALVAGFDPKGGGRVDVRICF